MAINENDVKNKQQSEMSINDMIITCWLAIEMSAHAVLCVCVCLCIQIVQSMDNLRKHQKSASKDSLLN